MSAERVQARTDGPVLHLTLNRPDKRNAIDSGLVEALHEALTTAELSSEVRVVALRGAGTDFSAGADLAELLASAELPAEANAESAERLGQVFVRMRELPLPVVAVVHGRAVAGGFGLASACDIILAREDASFGYPEVQRGFVPAMVMAMLRRAVGEKVAFDLVTTGRLLTAREALDLGLISRVMPVERFETDVAHVLSDLSALSPSAVALTKRQLYALDGLEFQAGIKLGAQVNAVARGMPDFREAVERFLKR
ncbi:MAG: enoyl-CoA hydratase/isomerase family protein [Gemmatimonadetes bacterium]|nr:enoyl-CoA hydratase/isomerase family protein [Gemmatimonadota bacterium]MBI2402009.1 enoyl-CoA hydratase/isomerase family protein [Gemmatimonadota bacterium]MBI2614128.1 enoyl-CoA hydratase/isomerase family protein [Gemmatimonadota bacterium]